MKTWIYKFISAIFLFSIIISFVDCGGGGKSLKGDKIETTDEMTRDTDGKEGASGISDFDRGHKDTKKEKDGSKGSTSMPRRSEISSRRGATPSASGLKAGYVDDNRQYNYFIDFIKKYDKDAPHYPFDIHERIVLKVADSMNKSIPNASVKIFSGRKEFFSGRTYADGSVLFFPSEYDKSTADYKVQVDYNQTILKGDFSRAGKREVDLRMNIKRNEIQSVPLDILFIFDTTGSMGEEIARLKTTIEIIHLNLTSLSSKPRVRFGMVLYKDIRDSYVTKIIPFTDDLDRFREDLNQVEASGGGDYPEDLQSALNDAVYNMKWNSDGIRLAFIITDAPPHLDYGQKYTYKNASEDFRKNAVKIFSVGTGGLNLAGEYVLRQIAQYTQGKYIFLTYGEKGESEGGKPGSVSHHTGDNFTTDKLETIIMRFAKVELSFLTDKPIEDGDPYFEARKVDTEEKKDTLKKLFDMAINQLVDYSSIAITEKTRSAVLPISAAEKSKSMDLNSEYFTEQLILSLSGSSKFKMVERKDLQKLLKEMEMQMSGLVDQNNASRVGKLMGAEMLIVGKLYQKDKYYEIFIKLLRVETAEVIAVTRARIDVSLGL